MIGPAFWLSHSIRPNQIPSLEPADNSDSPVGKRLFLKPQQQFHILVTFQNKLHCLVAFLPSENGPGGSFSNCSCKLADLWLARLEILFTWALNYARLL